jgi:hypothetical protein
MYGAEQKVNQRDLVTSVVGRIRPADATKRLCSRPHGHRDNETRKVIAIRIHNEQFAMTTTSVSSFFRTRLRGGLLLSALLLTAACASTPPAPTAQIQAAQLAITNAESVDAGHFAAGELGEARTKLAAAEAAVKAEKMVAAGQLAEQSRTDADLATARTGAAKAKAVNDDMKKSTGTLVEEMQRNSGEKT